ncbi:MAG: integrase family protein [Alphaproteobacteria bacterium]|nr:integrase family protein [Alphaproteobacteria bacterium]
MAHQFYFNPYILDNLPAPVKGFDVVQDISEPRLRMYITSHGVKTFFVRKRVRGKDKRILIGPYPNVDIEDARAAVQSILDNVMKKPPVRRKKITFKQFLDLYLEKKVRRGEDSYMKLLRTINRHLVTLFDRKICEISSDDVRNVVGNIHGRAIAARMQELLQSVFNYAIDMGYVKTNPVAGLEKIKQNRRIRPLNRAGLVRLIDAIGNVEDVVLRSAFYMLIYGFAPRSKIFSMSWEDLDFNHDMWNGWPLSNRAIVLLQDMPQDGQWVFAGRGGMHITDPRTTWRRVAVAAGIPNLTMDDVYKFLMRRVVWASDREDLRNNLNELLDDILYENQ